MKLPIPSFAVVPLCACVFAFWWTHPLCAEQVTEYETQFEAAVEAGDGERALAIARDRMEADDPLGQRFKIQLLAMGLGVDQDYERAVQMLEEIARDGDVDAMMEMSLAYEEGVGVEADPEQAAKWVLKAAEAGDVEAQLEYAERLAAGNGVDQDKDEALQWAQRAAEQGNQLAIDFALGLMARMAGLEPDEPDQEPGDADQQPEAIGSARITGEFDFEADDLNARIEYGNFVEPDMTEPNTLLVVSKLSQHLYAEALEIAIWVRIPEMEPGTYTVISRSEYLESEPESGVSGAAVRYQPEGEHPRDSLTFEDSVKGELTVERVSDGRYSGRFELVAEDSEGNSIEIDGNFRDTSPRLLQ